MNQQLMSRKAIYIPQCAAGEISIRKCAKLIGVTPQTVCSLKKRYKKYGAVGLLHESSVNKKD